MPGTVVEALTAIPDALALGFAAMSFETAVFRRVATEPGARDLALLTVYLAGVSQAIGHGVVLFLNRVRPGRFVLSLALMGGIYLVAALTTAVAAPLVADLAFGRQVAFLPTVAVIALAHSPRLLGCLTLAPYFGEWLDRLVDVWILTLVLYGLHRGLDLPVSAAALLALLGWGTAHLLALVLGRPLTALVTAARHAAAGAPLTLDTHNLVDSLKEMARSIDRRDRDG